MIQSKKFLFIIKLTFLLAFFLFTLFELILTYSINLSYFLQDTFLSTLNNILNNSFFNISLIILRAFSIFLLLGCIIGILIIFYYDIIQKQKLV